MRHLYLQLFKSRGIKLVFAYFLNAHIFDLRNKTDTHLIVPLKEMQSTSANLSHSLMYMVSWSSTLRKSFLKTKVLFNLQNFDFIDLGSGKGKATLYARKSNLLGESDRYFGIDFEKSLVEIAKRNSIKMFGDPGNFFAEDVVEVEWDKYSRKLLIYMYNPFDSIVLKQVLEKIKTKKVIIVYVNPVETPLLVENGYKILYSFKSWHANLTYTLFTNMQILTEGRRQ